MNLAEALRSSLRPHLSAISIESLIQRHIATPSTPVRDLSAEKREELAERLTASARLFSASEPSALRAQIRSALALETAAPGEGSERPNQRVLLHVRKEVDVSLVRNEARRMVSEAGIGGALPVKVATAVSELARNIVLYAGSGTIAIEIGQSHDGPMARIVARDEGPGISAAQLQTIFAGTYRSKSGLGKGIAAVKRVASEFDIQTAPGKGTAIEVVFRGLA
jgi:serine/threonine-protein kinase RsbT